MAPQTPATGIGQFVQQGKKGTTFDFKGLLSYLDQLQGQVTQKVEGRYGQLLNTIRGGTSAALGEVGNFGNAAIEQARRSAASDVAGVDQGFAARGFYNSTLPQTFATRINEGRDRTIAGIQEQRGLLRANIQQQGAGALAGAMERREDVYPRIESFLPLLQQASQAQREDTVFKDLIKQLEEMQQKQGKQDKLTALISNPFAPRVTGIPHLDRGATDYARLIQRYAA